jgi:hypothetical protein
MKPTVYFIGDADYDRTLFPGYEVALVMGLNHPKLGMGRIRTSAIVEKFDDGSFETMNTIYVPYTENTNG